MGWLGIFNWYSGESNKDIIKRELFGSQESKWEDLKWSSKGSHVWVLARNKETGFISATVILCNRYRKEHEFRYKALDLTSGPCETDMPKSWLTLIDKSYFEDSYSKEWLEKFQTDKPKEPKVKIGNLYECYGPFNLEWGDGYKIRANDKFFIKVEPKVNLSKTTKQFVVYKKNEDGTYYRANRRICSRSFRNLTKTLIGESND